MNECQYDKMWKNYLERETVILLNLHQNTKYKYGKEQPMIMSV